MGNSYQPLSAMLPDQDQPHVAANAWSFRGVDGVRVEFGILAAALARVRLLPHGVAPATSWAVERADWPKLDIQPQTQESGMTLTTAAMSVEIASDPFRIQFRWPDGASFAEDDLTLGMGI